MNPRIAAVIDGWGVSRLAKTFAVASHTSTAHRRTFGRLSLPEKGGAGARKCATVLHMSAAASSAERVSTQSASSCEPRATPRDEAPTQGPRVAVSGRRARSGLDRAGAVLSILCGVHCLLLPIVLAAAPWIAHAGSWERAEMIAAWTAVALVALLVLGEWGRRPDPRLLLGAAIIVAAQVLHAHLLIPLGSAVLIVGHVRRLRTRECAGHAERVVGHRGRRA